MESGRFHSRVHASSGQGSTKVEGWDLLFKPGKQEFVMTAPSEPGEYVVVCTVICSEEHEGMHMRFTVLP